MQFRRSIKLAPGMRMKLGVVGAGWTPGTQAQVRGKGGILHTVIPGAALARRERTGTLTCAGRTRQLMVTVAVGDDGELVFSDANGMPVSESLAASTKRQKGDAIRCLIQEACDQINRQIEALGELHLHTPAPRLRPIFIPGVFALPAPQKPLVPPLGIFARHIKSRVRQHEWLNARACVTYGRLHRYWEMAQDEFDQLEHARRALFDAVQRGEHEAIEAWFGQALQRIAWPKETEVSFEAGACGTRLCLDLGLPDINDMPDRTASVPPRGFSLSIRPLGPAQVQRLYAQHVHSMCFRLLGEAFATLPTLREVLLSGCSQRPDGDSGRVQEDCLFSVRVARCDWELINFAQLRALDVTRALEELGLVRDMARTGTFRAIQPLRA